MLGILAVFNLLALFVGMPRYTALTIMSGSIPLVAMCVIICHARYRLRKGTLSATEFDAIAEACEMYHGAVGAQMLVFVLLGGFSAL